MNRKNLKIFTYTTDWRDEADANHSQSYSCHLTENWKKKY